MLRREALVLRTVPYGDRRVIINVYTAEEGNLGLIASLSKKSSKGLKPAHFQALQNLEIVYQPQGKGDLKRLAEARIISPYQELYFDPLKSCLSLFLAELLQKVLSGEEGVPILFQFVVEAMHSLDESSEGLANFHLLFMMKLSAYLGFQPQIEPEAHYFDLMHGESKDEAPHHPYFIAGSELDLWRNLSLQPWDNWPDFSLRNKELRKQALENMIQYYRLQLHDFGALKSLSVLREVLA